MKYILKILFLFITFLIISCNNKKKNNLEKEHIDDYSARIDSIIETKSPRFFNGVILITKQGETKYLNESGYSDFENKVAISAKDRFRIMSNSK